MIVASCRAESACCPRCGQEPARVHGRYARMVADGAGGWTPANGCPRSAAPLAGPQDRTAVRPCRQRRGAVRQGHQPGIEAGRIQAVSAPAVERRRHRRRRAPRRTAGPGGAGSEQTVRRSVRPFRQALAAPGPARAVPKTRQITRWLLTRPDHLQAGEQAQLDAIRVGCPHIDALARHVTAFAEMMTARTGSRDLESWLAAVEADGQSGLRSFAIGIRND